MSSKIKSAAFAAALVVAACSFMYTAIASSDNAGSSGDPLVTKSYVDTAMANVLNVVNGSQDTGSLPLQTETSGGFEPVSLQKGQILLGKGGSEIILRSGSALSYTESTDGIIDVTSGQEYYNGQSLTANHLLIVSRDDGRGASVTSDEAWFIVKGGYTIK